MNPSRILPGLLILASCATPPPPKPLSPREQIVADSEKARGLVEDFKRGVRFVHAPRPERFLTRMAARLAASSKEIPLEQIEVRIHEDSTPGLSRSFSFPGTFVSLPLGWLRKASFENQVAALISYELGNVINRHLAGRVEAAQGKVELFGPDGVFSLAPAERARSIRSGLELLYFAGYDVRGMTSLIREYPVLFAKPGSEIPAKEVESDLREAQRAGSELLPSLRPVVRSSEFIQFKKELDRIRKSI